MLDENYEEANHVLVGAKILGIEEESSDYVCLALEDGRRVSLSLTSPCCSSSHFSSYGQFDELSGATIQQIDERYGETTYENLDDEPCDKDDRSTTIKWHFLVFITERGHTTIDWRNDSNGCYDGEIRVSIQQPTKN